MSPSAFRRALAWAPAADDPTPLTVADRRPEARLRDLDAATAPPRPVEDDPIPSSRPSALAALLPIAEET